ncbi:hypothetical protein [Nocardia gipuzkoensis]
MSISESIVVLVIVIGSAAFWGAAALAWGVWFIKGLRNRPRYLAGESKERTEQGSERMKQYTPGPDGNSGDNYNEDPRGKDAPQRRLGADTRLIASQD